MDFVQSELEIALRDSLDRFLTDKYDFITNRRNRDQWSPELWKAFADELGILGASVSEDAGGLGGGAAEIGAIMERFGRFLVREPFLSTIVMGAGILRRAQGDLASSVLNEVVVGEAIVAVGCMENEATYDPAAIATRAETSNGGYQLSGRKVMVLDAPHADWLIIPARTAGEGSDREGVSLFLIAANAPGIQREDYTLLDGASASTITLKSVAATHENLICAEGDGSAILDQVLDEAAAAVCAEACGLMQAMLDQTVTYTQERQQFGKPIADNQVLKHRMVDMLVAVKQANNLLAVAHIKLDTPDRSAAVSAAKSRIGQLCRFVAQSAVQLHGAIGITDETAISHYFSRGLMLERLFGSVDYHLERYIDLQLPAG